MRTKYRNRTTDIMNQTLTAHRTYKTKREAYDLALANASCGLHQQKKLSATTVASLNWGAYLGPNAARPVDLVARAPGIDYFRGKPTRPNPTISNALLGVSTSAGG